MQETLGDAEFSSYMQVGGWAGGWASGAVGRGPLVVGLAVDVCMPP